MAEILASGTSVANSSTVTLAAGESATLALRVDADGGGANVQAAVQKQGSDTNWYTIGVLSHKAPCMVLSAVGSFRVRRIAADVAFGVDKD
jgi:hypothetical protein